MTGGKSLPRGGKIGGKAAPYSDVISISHYSLIAGNSAGWKLYMPEKEDLSLYIKNDSDDISSSKLLFEISIFDDNQFDFPPKSQNQPKMVE